MFHDFLVVAGSVAALFLMMAVGFFFGKRKWLSKQTLSQLSHLLLSVVCPCTVIDALQVDFSVGLLRQMGLALALLVVSYGIYALATGLMFGRQPPPTRAALRFGAMYGNVGFMGLPLIMAVLGQEAVPFCAVALAVFNAANWTHGAALMGQRPSLRRAVLNPGVIGFLVAAGLFLSRVPLPSPVLSAVSSLGALNTPLAMVIIGGQMADSGLLETFREKKLYLTALVKLILMPLATLAALRPLDLEPTVYLTLVILSACPTAGTTSIFCQRFGQDTGTAARLVTLSTLLSIVTLPLLTLLARAVAG